MKICLFSDIHGNGVVFESVYLKLLHEKADLNIFLGDLCGYYFDEVEIYKKLLNVPNLIALKGNHDKMFLSAIEGNEAVKKEYAIRYGSSMKNFLNKDNKAMVKWLRERPEFYFYDEIGLACYHGSPKNKIDGYIYPDTDLAEIANEKHAIFFLGHTHYPMQRFIGDKMVLNPGSLGQPRQGGWPTYAVVTFPEKKVEFKEVPYDVSELRRIIEQKGGENFYLQNVLLRCDEKNRE